MTADRRRLGVALVLEPPLADEVDGLRRALGDTSLGRVPPHLTLVPPVNVRAAEVGAALGRLRRACGALGRPLALTVGAVATFLPANPVVYLGVGGDLEGLGDLRDLVFAPPLERSLSWPWVPHVTVADGISPEKVPAALVAMGEFAAAFTARWAVLLEQRPGRIWRPLADAALERPAVVGTGGLALEITSSRLLDPETTGLLEDAGSCSFDGRVGEEGWRRGTAGFFPIVLAGRREGELVGVAAGFPGPGGADVVVVVREGRRGEGIGTHLLRRLELLARSAGWPFASLRAWGPEGFYAARSDWCAVTRTPPPSTGPAS